MVDFKALRFQAPPGVELCVLPGDIERAIASFRREVERRFERDYAGEDINHIIEHEGRLGLLVDELADVTFKETGLERGSEDWEENQARQRNARNLRLAAQKDRAAGGHIVLATQYPSVDVVTTAIKVSSDFRIHYRVTQTAAGPAVLDDPAAASLPPIKGRGLVGPRGFTEPTQLYWVDPAPFRAGTPRSVP
jgi:hypothetical protein